MLSIAVVVSGCSVSSPAADGLPPEPAGSVLLDAEVVPLLESVPRDSLATASMARLADGLVPPTNRWFSGLIFGDEPQPVFPLPLSFRLGESGFSFGVPTIMSTPGLIAGPMTDHVSVTTDATSTLVTRYDEVSVTISLLAADDAPIAEVTIARGSPVVSYRALVAHELALSVPVAEVPDADGVWAATEGGFTYALVTPAGEVTGDTRTLSLPAGASANWVAVPEGAEVEKLAAHAASPLVGVAVEYGIADGSATTLLRYVTDDGSPTLIGSLPHQSAPGPVVEGDTPECSFGTVSTTYGVMQVCASTALSYAVPASAPDDATGFSSLDLNGLSGADRDELISTLALDAGTLPDLPADTYFGGKALARIATLLSLARELDESSIADELRERLIAELRTWTQLDGCVDRADRCFVYDPALRGMVGQVPSFGSEEFNDHHFHYGSFIYAAAIAAAGDDALIAELRPMISLLVADIASSGGETFPTRRAFDPYSGHSWASGFSPFADGNNQESSSEAVAAHAAVALWGAVAGDAGIEEAGRWMLALESFSASTYYTAVDTSAEPYASFDRGVVGILWDGKRDYATWFSAEPAAILGIQLLPLRPGTSSSLAGDPERILANIAEATASGPAPQFADYLLMYQALAGSDQAELALEAARDLPYSSIDDGNSRSYLLAFIMVQR
jgi:endoglucanase Acf2